MYILLSVFVLFFFLFLKLDMICDPFSLKQILHFSLGKTSSIKNGLLRFVYQSMTKNGH